MPVTLAGLGFWRSDFVFFGFFLILSYYVRMFDGAYVWGCFNRLMCWGAYGLPCFIACYPAFMPVLVLCTWCPLFTQVYRLYKPEIRIIIDFPGIRFWKCLPCRLLRVFMGFFVLCGLCFGLNPIFFILTILYYASFYLFYFLILLKE